MSPAVSNADFARLIFRVYGPSPATKQLLKVIALLGVSCVTVNTVAALACAVARVVLPF